MGKLFAILIVCAFALSCGQKKKKNEEASQPEVQATQQKSETQTAPEAQNQGMATAEGAVTCQIKGDERTIKVEKGDNGGCEVYYTKFGESKSVASANNDINFCNEKMERIKSNLESAGFNCQ